MAGLPSADEQAQAVQMSKGTGVFVPRDNSAARHRMLQARARSNLPSRSDAGHNPSSKSGSSGANRGGAQQQIHASMLQQHPPLAMMGSMDTSSKRGSSNGSSILEYSHSIDFQFSKTPSAVSTPVLNQQGRVSAAEFSQSPYSGHLGAELPLQSPNDFWSMSGASSPLASSINPAASISSSSSDFSSSTTSHCSLVDIDSLCEQLALLQQQDKLLQEKEQNLVMQQKLLQRLDSSTMAMSHNSISSTSMANNSSNSMLWSNSAAMQQWQGPASYPLQANSSMLSAVPAALAGGSVGHSATALQLPATHGNSSSAQLRLSRTLSASAVPMGSGVGNWSGSNHSTAWQGGCQVEMPSTRYAAAAAAATAWHPAAPVAAPPVMMPAGRVVQEVYSSSFDQGTRSAASMAAKIAQLAELQALQQEIQQELLQLLC